MLYLSDKTNTVTLSSFDSVVILTVLSDSAVPATGCFFTNQQCVFGVLPIRRELELNVHYVPWTHFVRPSGLRFRFQKSIYSILWKAILHWVFTWHIYGPMSKPKEQSKYCTDSTVYVQYTDCICNYLLVYSMHTKMWNHAIIAYDVIPLLFTAVQAASSIPLMHSASQSQSLPQF